MPVSMRRYLVACGAAVSLLVAGAGAASASPVGEVAAQPAAGQRAAQRAVGTFVVELDFSSLAARDVRGNKCELSVDGTLTFDGTVSGVATGSTTAVIFAPCAEATASPPGTYFDIFHTEAVFSGTVDGAPLTAGLTYSGVTRVGGSIDGIIRLGSGQGGAVLRADAEVGVGGAYRGVAHAP